MAIMKQRFVHLLAILLVLTFLPIVALAVDKTGTVTASALNMRSKASTDGSIVTTIPNGGKVTITGSSGNWYKVTYKGKTGYVWKDYVKVTGSTSTSSGSTSSSSTSSSSSTLSTLKSIGRPSACKPGDSGANVKKLQKCLQALGYYKGEINGKYDDATTEAVKKFQKANKSQLTVDGIAGKNTIAVMFGESVSSSSGYTTERLDWFSHTGTIPKGATFTVKDCWTGKTFTCKRWSGANHMDSEPLTASDTATMLSIYGGSWSWNRRPILVKYNGHVYAASMNGMPHGTTTISGNNFDGHFCIHFYGSMTHETKRVDEAHQNCVAIAMKYTW